MMKKLRWALCLLLAASVLPMDAQSVITVQKENVVSHTGVPDGKGRIVFRSHSSELVITSSVKDDPVCDEPVKVKDAYEYRMLCDISSGSDKRVFTIALKGTTIMEKTGQIQLFANKTPCFSVELVNNPITMELSPDGSQFIAEGNGWALIEFNSETPLTVKYNEALKGKLKSGRSKAGTYVDSLIINVEAIAALNDEVNGYASRIEALEKRYDEMVKTATDEELDEITKEKDELDSVKAQREDQLYEMTRISIKGEGTNERVVDADVVKGLASKGKLRYNVVLLTKTKTVFKTRYEELIHQAESHKQTRDYALAKSFYEGAAEAEGASDTDKQIAMQCAEKMGRLAEFKAETDRVADELYMLSYNNKRVNKDAFCALIDDIAQRYDALYAETGEAYYQNEAERLRKQKENVGFVLKGKCVISEYKGGAVLETPFAGVEIYASDRSKSEEMNKSSYPFKGKLLGKSDAKGAYSFTLKDGEYKTIIYVAPASAKFKKNKSVSLEGRTGDRNVKVRFSMDKDK